MRGRDRVAAEKFMRWIMARGSGGTSWDEAPEAVRELMLSDVDAWKAEARPLAQSDPLQGTIRLMLDDSDLYAPLPADHRRFRPICSVWLLRMVYPNRTMSYICSCCGELHEDLPNVAFDRPIYAHQMPEGEREERVCLNSDFCVIDEEDHFIRGLLEIPIHGQDAPLGIGVWVSQKRENFWTYREHFNSSNIGPFFGWLSNELRYEGESTLNLKTMAHFKGGSLRPNIVLEPTDHPLAIAQRDGITLDQAWAFVHAQNDPSDG